MIKLKSLKLTSTDLFRVPKCRRNGVRYVNADAISTREIDIVNFHLSSLPVVSEDDLSGTLSSGSGGRGGAAILYRKSGGLSSTSSTDALAIYTETIPHFMTFCPAVMHLYLVQVDLLLLIFYKAFELNLFFRNIHLILKMNNKVFFWSECLKE